jgi:peptidoglycan/xylan/chitin deacetylase (PgdA/CDA1 family)
MFIVAGETGGVSHWRTPELQRPLLSWGGIRELVKMGHEIGSHGLHHRDLTSASSAELKAEIAISKKLIEDNVGMPVNAFSYPWGKHNARVENAVREAGYACAVQVGGKRGNGHETNRFCLQRKIIGQADSLVNFERNAD